MRIHLQINKEEGERDEKKRQARIYNAKIHIYKRGGVRETNSRGRRAYIMKKIKINK